MELATPNTNGILLPGDYFGVNGEMKMVTTPLNNSGSGEGAAPFKPAAPRQPGGQRSAHVDST